VAADTRDSNEKRELTFKEEGQEYAQVLKMLGNGRLEAMVRFASRKKRQRQERKKKEPGLTNLQCFDGVKRLGLIRGKLRKKIWINNGDIILVSLREYQDEKGDVILKYNADEARSLYAPPRILPLFLNTN
jgi:translation initiation factor 1A